MNRLFVVHPFLLTIYPILFLFAYNAEQVLFYETLVPTGIALGFTLSLVLLSWLILRDCKKAGIVVSILLVLFFSYGHIYHMIGGGDPVEGWQIGSFLIARHRYLLLLWSMLFICGAYFNIRTSRDLHSFTNILNIIAFSLVVISLFSIGVQKFKSRGARQQDSYIDREVGKTNTVDLENVTILPDIYYIILDGYARSSTLKEMYDYGNDEFSDYLIERGFYIASESRCNYPYTFLSLASSLNMEYINYLSDALGVESGLRTVPYQMIEDNKVVNFLRSKGYKFINFNSGWHATDRNKYADMNIMCGIGNEFLMVLIRETMLSAIEGYFGFLKRRRVLCTFAKLAEVSKIEGPTFTFAHLCVPHHPFVFGANGEAVTAVSLAWHESGGWEQKEKYVNQLIFVNKKTKVLIDRILSNSDTLPIIILQADHGPDLTPGNPFSVKHPTKSMHPTQSMLKERMHIFNAYHLPRGGKDLLYESISPVNSFRLIFNFYFNTNYKLLSDQNYYSTNNYPYRFVNVTGKID